MWLKTEYFPRLLISLHCEVYGQMSPWSQSSGVTGVSLLGLCWASEPGILWKCVYSSSPASGRFGLGLSWKIFPIFRFYKDLKVCKACTLIKKSDSFSWSWNKPSIGSMGNSGAWTHPPTLKLMSFRATLVSPDFPLFLSWSDHSSDLCSVLKQNELYSGKLMCSENWQPQFESGFFILPAVYLWARLPQFPHLSLGKIILSFPHIVTIKWDSIWKSPGT